MRKRNIILLSAILVLVAATTAGMAGEKAEQAAAEHQCWAQKNPEKAAELRDLATKAEAGCEHSKAALIAKAKEVGCEETVELAKKAEGGCEKSTQALIAKAKNMGVDCKCEGKCGDEKKAADAHDCNELDAATLAAHAESGCPKAKAMLIAHAKEHGCAEMKALAEKAEGGCDESMQKLVAMAKEEKKAE
jgi:hypothetical protein